MFTATTASGVEVAPVPEPQKPPHATADHPNHPKLRPSTGGAGTAGRTCLSGRPRLERACSRPQEAHARTRSSSASGIVAAPSPAPVVGLALGTAAPTFPVRAVEDAVESTWVLPPGREGGGVRALLTHPSARAQSAQLQTAREAARARALLAAAEAAHTCEVQVEMSMDLALHAIS